MKTTKGIDFATKLKAAGVTVWKWGKDHNYFYATKGDRHVVVMFVENGRFCDAVKTDRFGNTLRDDPNRTLRSMTAVERYLGI